MDYERKKKLVKLYFKMGYPYSLILRFLAGLHGIVLSMRTLKRMLHKMGLKRRVSADLSHVFECIQLELSESGSLLGYRSMHLRLLQKYGVTIARDDVRVMLSFMDPEGVAMRKRRRLNRRVYSSKGPNYCWHVDGNDKLVPFGFAIHGGIDGYSRKILWLEVSPTNKDSKVIAGYYLQAVERYGCPKTVRADKGTENAKISYIHPFLRHQCTEGRESSDAFRYGKSTNNQRIERLWGSVYQWCNCFWIDFFKILREKNYFDDTNVIHRDCLKFAFMEVIQADLDWMRDTWNSHCIRANKVNDGGIPDDLFFLPEQRGYTDYSKDCDVTDVQLCWQHASSKPQPNLPEFTNLAKIVMEEESLQLPTSPKEALSLYFDLINNIIID